jgi:hypothetical protein
LRECPRLDANPFAEKYIAWHGWSAADKMVPYLCGKKHEIRMSTAIKIINHVQIRGCSLKGTKAEKCLKDFLERAPAGSPERLSAKFALEHIQEDLWELPQDYDGLTGGPCDRTSRGSLAAGKPTPKK